MDMYKKCTANEQKCSANAKNEQLIHINVLLLYNTLLSQKKVFSMQKYYFQCTKMHS